jgi:hypothetical protein
MAQTGFSGTAAANTTLDAWFGSTTLGPSQYELRLYTVAPTAAGGGTEVTGGGYSPLTIDNDATNFDPAASGIKYNNADWDFGAASGAAWGTIVGIGYHNPSGGALVRYGPLNTSATVSDGDSFVVLSGTATLKEL